MNVIVPVLHLLLIVYITVLVYRKIPPQPIKQFFIPGVLLKLLAGIIYGWIYWYYYGHGDTLNYFSDAKLLASLAANSPIDYLQGLFTNQFPLEIQHSLVFIHQPRALFLSKIASFFAFISWGNYWICSLYFSLFSFLGLFYLSHVCATIWPKQYWPIAIAFLFFPSVLFWSSGLNKESVVMGCMGFLAGIFLNFYYKKRRLHWQSLAVLLLSAYVVWVLKYYYAAILFPILISLLIIAYLPIKIQENPFMKVGIGAMILIGLLMLGSYLHPILTWSGFLQQLFEQHHAIVAMSSKENLILFDAFEPTLDSLLSHLPLALFSGLFRPGVWDAGNIFQWCAALENFGLLLLTIAAIGNIKKLFQRPTPLLLWGTIAYILIMATLLAFAAPNFGTLVRYKIGFLPFLVLVVLVNNPLLSNFPRKFL